MKNLLKRIRSAVGTGLSWAAGWAPVGGGLMEMLVDPMGSIVDVWPSSREAKIRR